jgi:methionine synthase II (cobalamin-independent)
MAVRFCKLALAVSSTDNDEAAKFIPLEQLAISPQCGFASDVVGNLITATEQKRKLELVVETVRQVFGKKQHRLCRDR